MFNQAVPAGRFSLQGALPWQQVELCQPIPAGGLSLEGTLPRRYVKFCQAVQAIYLGLPDTLLSSCFLLVVVTYRHPAGCVCLTDALLVGCYLLVVLAHRDPPLCESLAGTLVDRNLHCGLDNSLCCNRFPDGECQDCQKHDRNYEVEQSIGFHFLSPSAG
jgi:hypothetical protein